MGVLLITNINGACGGSDSTAPEPTNPVVVPTQVEISPSSAMHTALGDTTQFEIFLSYSDGRVVKADPAVRLRLDGESATVSNFTAVSVRNGVHRIIAEATTPSRILADTLLLTVEQEANTLTVEGVPRTLALGATARLTVTAADRRGNPLTPISARIVTSREDRLSVERNNLRARGLGLAIVRVSVGSTTWTSEPVTVNEPAPATGAFTWRSVAIPSEIHVDDFMVIAPDTFAIAGTRCPPTGNDGAACGAVALIYRAGTWTEVPVAPAPSHGTGVWGLRGDTIFVSAAWTTSVGHPPSGVLGRIVDDAFTAEYSCTVSCPSFQGLAGSSHTMLLSAGVGPNLRLRTTGAEWLNMTLTGVPSDDVFTPLGPIASDLFVVVSHARMLVIPTVSGPVRAVGLNNGCQSSTGQVSVAAARDVIIANTEYRRLHPVLVVGQPRHCDEYLGGAIQRFDLVLQRGLAFTPPSAFVSSSGPLRV